MKTFLEQMRKIWGQLGLNQRITLSLAALVVIGGMVGLVLWSHRPTMQLLYGRLAEKDVSEIVAAVQEQGVQFQLGNGGSSIYVPSNQVHKMRMLLASKGIPSGEGVGFEIFDRSNFGISDFVQRTNYLRALQGELSRTIAQLHGVRSARVMIVMPENRLLFSDQKSKATASVFIDASASGLGQDNVNAIRFLVANSVEGLRADDVALVDSRGNLLTENLKEDGSLAIASSQMKYRKGVEDYFSNKVETMLAKVLGPGNAVVRVSAEIDTDNTTKTQEVFDPEGQVVRNEQTTEDTTTTTEVDGAGAQTPPVGVTANTPNNSSTDASKAGKNSEQVRKNKTNAYELNRTTTNSVKMPGGITRVSAAVFVAPKAQARTAEEIEALRKMVANALGIKSDDAQEMARNVTIQETAFENQPLPKAGGYGDLLASNTDALKNLGAALIAFVLLAFFLRMLKKTKPDEIPFELIQAASAPVSRSYSKASELTPDVLNEMIRQKPANVGAALRGWMANGNSRP